MYFFFFQAEDGIRDGHVTGVQTCALPIYRPLICWEIRITIISFCRMNSVNRWTTGKRSLFISLVQPEIGRASCRERVWISVVGGACEKKKDCVLALKWC